MLLLAFAAGAFFFFAWRAKGWPDGGLLSSRKSSASWSILEEIRSLEELETAAYDMKIVFPFDFIGDDDPDWAYLKFQYDADPELFLRKADPAWHPGGHVPDAWRYAELYDLCRKVGIDPGRPDYRFVVLSAVVRAGVDLEAWTSGFETAEPGGEVDGISVSEDEGGDKRLEIASPPVTILSFAVRDRNAAAEGFPDVPISPERWRLLTDALEPKLRDMALHGGLLEAAEEDARSFLAEIFTAAGYRYVSFID
jgi:hypothetical protein